MPIQFSAPWRGIFNQVSTSAASVYGRWKSKPSSSPLKLAGLLLLGSVATMPAGVVVGEGHIQGTASLNDTSCSGNNTRVSDFLNSTGAGGPEGVSSGGFSADSASGFSYYNPVFGFWWNGTFIVVCPANTKIAPTATSHLLATGFAPFAGIANGTPDSAITYKVKVNPLSTDHLGLCLFCVGCPTPQVYYPWYVDGGLGLNGNRKRYVLDEYRTQADGSTVKPLTALTLKDIPEYPGLIHFSLTCANQQFYDGHGPLITATITAGATPSDPVPANPERRLGAQGSVNTVQAQVLRLAASPTTGGISETFAVRGGLTYQLDISYSTGTDPYGSLPDPLLYWRERRKDISVPAGCQVDVTDTSLSCTAGTNLGCFFGAISGQVDMLTRYELFETEVHAINGPMGNLRYGRVLNDPTPSSGTYLLTNVMPTNLGLDPTAAVPGQDPCYGMTAYLSFCSGGFLENFQSPPTTACVTNCSTNDLGDIFVMTPSTASGALNFLGPDGSVPGCPDYFQKLQLPQFFVSTPESNCVPANGFNGPPIPNVTSFSYVSASGGGGGAQASFSLNGGSGVYSGAYELTLASLNGQTTSWNPNQLALFFNDPTTVPADHIQETLHISNQAFTPAPVSVGPTPQAYTTGRDHDYCFSDVTIPFTAAPGTLFFKPRLSGGGSFSGVDHWGNAASYTMSVSAYGTPGSTPAASGEVHLCLPAGTYTLTPAIDYDGGGSATLPNITFTVDCNQCLELPVGGPALTVSNIPCITGTNAVVSGTAAAVNPATLTQVECWVNGILVGTATSSPFTFNFTPTACINLVEVKATDSAGLVTTVQQSVGLASSAPLTLSGCQDIVVNAPPGPPVNVTYNNITAGNGGCPVTLTFNPPAPGPFPLGTTPVTCTAVDACGNSTNCTFDVIVRACATITDDTNSCAGQGNFNYTFTVNNPPGAPTIGFLQLVPASGCFAFTPSLVTPSQGFISAGTSDTATTLLSVGANCPQQLCFDVVLMDDLGDYVCTQHHCLDNPALPQIDCPPDIVTNCLADEGTFVDYAVPAATNPCCSIVSVTCSPLPGTFPIGVTPVTCVAVDSCGFSNFCTFNVTVVGHANGQVARWVKSDAMSNAGSSSGSRANAIAVDKAGNAYVGGSFSGSVQFLKPNSTYTTLNSVGGLDIFLAKYDTAGKLLWVRSAGGSVGDDQGLGVAVDDQGDCYVTGAFTDSASFSTETISGFPGGQHAFVAKYDDQGNVLWVLSAGGLGSDVGAGVAVDAAGNCYVTGHYQGGATFNTTAGSSAWVWGYGYEDCFLAKYDPAGALQWVTGSDGSGPYVAKARGVTVDPAGNTAWITGFFNANASGAPAFGATPALAPSTGGGDAFVAQCDVSALIPTWTWARQTFRNATAGASTADGLQIGVDNSGNCYFTAYFNGPTAMSANNHMPAAAGASLTPPGCNPYYNYLVGSLDFSGNPRWLRQGTGCGDDESSGLAVNAATGDTFVSGFLQGAGLYVSGGRNVAVFEYDTSGNLNWTGTGYGTSANFTNVGRSLALDNAGCVYVAGSFTDTNLIFYGFPTPILRLTEGYEAMLLAKYCPSCSNCVAPQIVSQPQSVSLTTGPSASHPVSFSVTASGSGPLSYHWYRNNVALNPGGGAFSGPCHTVTVTANTSTLLLTGVPPTCTAASDSGIYQAVVQNSCCDCPVSTHRVSVYYMIIDPGSWHVDPGTFSWGVSANTGMVFQVEYRDDLKPGTPWQWLTNGVGTGTTSPVVDLNPNPTNRFYRIVPVDGP